MTEPSVVVESLWESYRQRGRLGWRRGEPVWALRDIDLRVDRGSSLGVVGGNGSGKTTLLQVLAGVLRPTRGRVEVRGRVASLVDLSAGFHRDLTGHENVLVGGVLLGLGRQEIRRRYDEIVAFSGLPVDALRLAVVGLLRRHGASAGVLARGAHRAGRAPRRRGPRGGRRARSSTSAWTRSSSSETPAARC